MVARQDISGDVAVVARSRAGAKSAARALASRLPRARLRPLSEDEYLLILASEDGDAAARRGFFESARERFLWPAPASDLYAAIEGVLTRLPRRRQRPPSSASGDFATALLLEGEVGPDRTKAALASPVRRWIVEHPGRVRLSRAELRRLRDCGVEWSALEPVLLLGVALAGRAGGSPRGSPFRKAAVWRIRPAGSRARARKPSPR